MNIFKNKKLLYWILLLTIVGGGSYLGCRFIYNFNPIWEGISESIKTRLEDNRMYYSVLFISVLIGLVHLIFGGSRKNSLFIFKKLGPILSSPLTGLTYGVVINSSINFFYIICFDSETIRRYTVLDKTTISVTTLLLVVWSVAGLYGMINEIVLQKGEENIGEIIKTRSSKDL